MINRDNYQAMRKYLEYLLEVRQNEENTIKRRRIQLRHLLEWADEKPFSSAPAFDQPSRVIWHKTGMTAKLNRWQWRQLYGR